MQRSAGQIALLSALTVYTRGFLLFLICFCHFVGVKLTRIEQLYSPIIEQHHKLTPGGFVQAPSPKSLSFDKSDSGESVFSHWLNDAAKVDVQPEALT